MVKSPGNHSNIRQKIGLIPFVNKIIFNLIVVIDLIKNQPAHLKFDKQ